MLVKLYTLVSAALLVSVGITFGVLSQVEDDQEHPNFFCGTVSSINDSIYANIPALFGQYCSTCHTYDRKAIGPALAGIGQRRSRKWIIDWVHNSQAFIASGDSLAIAVFEENNGITCPPFPFLTEHQIDSLIVYLD